MQKIEMSLWLHHHDSVIKHWLKLKKLKQQNISKILTRSNTRTEASLSEDFNFFVFVFATLLNLLNNIMAVSFFLLKSLHWVLVSFALDTTDAFRFECFWSLTVDNIFLIGFPNLSKMHRLLFINSHYLTQCCSFWNSLQIQIQKIYIYFLFFYHIAAIFDRRSKHQRTLVIILWNQKALIPAL